MGGLIFAACSGGKKDPGIWANPDSGRFPDVYTTRDANLKELMFQKLEFTDIESIGTNGKNDFCAVDREGGYYRIEINDNKITQAYQGNYHQFYETCSDSLKKNLSRKFDDI